MEQLEMIIYKLKTNTELNRFDLLHICELLQRLLK